MIARFAIAVVTLVSLYGLALAAEPAGPETVEPPAVTTETEAETSPAVKSDDEDVTPDSTEEPAPSPDLHRHRPGACPEGPPCPEEDENGDDE